MTGRKVGALLAALCAALLPFGEGFAVSPAASFLGKKSAHSTPGAFVSLALGLDQPEGKNGRRESAKLAREGSIMPISMRAGEAVSRIFADRVLIGSEIMSAEITIEGSRISSVKRTSRAEWEAAGRAGYDVGAKHTVVPAFINAHTHLSMACIRGAASSTDFEGNVVEDMFFRFEGAFTVPLSHVSQHACGDHLDMFMSSL